MLYSPLHELRTYAIVTPLQAGTQAEERAYGTVWRSLLLTDDFSWFALAFVEVKETFWAFSYVQQIHPTCLTFLVNKQQRRQISTSCSHCA
jgi:hypothetical protein